LGFINSRRSGGIRETRHGSANTQRVFTSLDGQRRGASRIRDVRIGEKTLTLLKAGDYFRAVSSSAAEFRRASRAGISCDVLIFIRGTSALVRPNLPAQAIRVTRLFS